MEQKHAISGRSPDRPADNIKLAFGSKVIQLANPKVDQLDILEMEKRLRVIRRFSGDPDALFVDQHEQLVALLVQDDPLGIVPDNAIRLEAKRYALVHDHPEALTGDIPGPIKQFLLAHGDKTLYYLEHVLENLVLQAYQIGWASWRVREVVDKYDKLAAVMEWVYVLNREPAVWCYPMFNALPQNQQKQFIARICA